MRTNLGGYSDDLVDCTNGMPIQHTVAMAYLQDAKDVAKMKVVIDTDEGDIELNGAVDLEGLAAAIMALQEVGKAMSAGEQSLDEQQANEAERQRLVAQGMWNLQNEVEAAKENLAIKTEQRDKCSDDPDMIGYVHLLDMELLLLGYHIKDMEQMLDGTHPNPDAFMQWLSERDGIEWPQ